MSEPDTVDKFYQRAMTEVDSSVHFEHGHTKAEADPEAFDQLPANVLEIKGLRTHYGKRPLFDLVILAKLLHHARLRSYQQGTIELEYPTYGFTETLKPGEFVLSMESICEDYLAREFGEMGFDRENKEHDDFYRMTRKRIIRRLEGQNLVRRARLVGDQSDKHLNGRLGTVWTFTDTLLEDIAGRTRPAGDPKPPEYAEHQIEQGHLFSPFDLMGEDLREVADDKYRSYHETEVATSLDKGRFKCNYFEWTESIAKTGVKGDRYVRIGCRSPEHKGWFYPWIKWDIDGEDPFDSYDIARRIVDQLAMEEVPLEDVIIAFTGGRGFHVMLPAGLFDNPVFGRKKEAERAMKKVTRQLIDEEVDYSLFSPWHLSRCIGSQHPSTGLYMTGYRADDFRRTSMLEVMTEARNYDGCELPDPRETSPSWQLACEMMEARENGFYIPPMDEVPDPPGDETSSFKQAIDRIEDGVAESEDWGTDLNVEYVGRNRAAFEMSRHLLLSEQNMPYRQLQQWNQSNQPALPRGELRRTFESAQRYI